MASELNMYQVQNSELRLQMDTLNRDLQESRKRYYELKKRLQLIHQQKMEGLKAK